MTGRILIVDDQAEMVAFLEKALTKEGYIVNGAEDGEAAIKLLSRYQYDLVLTDLNMPKKDGMDILNFVNENLPNVSVIIMTAYGTIENAILSVRSGAYDYVTKPFHLDDLLRILNEYFGRNIQDHLSDGKSSFPDYPDLVGVSRPMRQIFRMISDIASSDASVLIQGPTGTGKELIATAIQKCSVRKDKPFIKVNCAALPDTLIESELFGHEKGAYTGAIRTRVGKFEAARGGTLLLDEISEMKMDLQAKLLRVLQEKEIQRLGSNSTIPVDVRIIATTNRDLFQEVKKGNFREDLFYRLNVIPIYIPPLCERLEDIPVLAQKFVSDFSLKYDKSVRPLTQDVLSALQSLPLEGNVRELENLIERAVVLAQGERIEVKDIQPPYLAVNRRSLEKPIPFDYPTTLEDIERRIILQTLDRLNDNRTKAAQQLGITTRTLRNKLQKYKEEGYYHDQIDQ